jgi:hypothetical protein
MSAPNASSNVSGKSEIGFASGMAFLLNKAVLSILLDGNDR